MLDMVREAWDVCVCLRLIIGNAVLTRLACVCVYSMYKLNVCARLRLLPRLAYHVEHQDKRVRRGVGVRAGGSQGRRELQAAADNELL